jgi:hypothetical protein
MLRTIAKKRSTTVRALACALRSEVIKVARSLEIKGNLSKAYKMEHPNAQMEDLYWVSYFQYFSDDSGMPAYVKEWLLHNYATRFDSKNN